MTGPNESKLDQPSTMSTPGRWAVLTYAAICYAGFQASVLWLILFVNGVDFVPSVNSGTQRPWLVALAINIALVLLFGLQHSVMARQSFKRVWTQVIPEAAERATYVLATVICLFLIFAYWSPMPAEVWQVEQPAAVYAILALQGVGWFVLVWASFAINHFHLFGLAQAWSAFTGRPVPQQDFRTPSIYRLVRHPIQLGILMGIWVVPTMTMGHLVFSIALTTYVFVGLYFEERDLIREFGERYQSYRRDVPKVLPRLWPKRRSTSDQQGANTR